MTSPKEQAIEEAHQAAVAEAWKLVTARNGDWTLDGEKEKRVIATRGIFEEFLLFYSGARARIDGAKMMPREATEEQLLAALRVSRSDDYRADDTIGGAVYRAMHDATPNDGERG